MNRIFKKIRIKNRTEKDSGNAEEKKSETGVLIKTALTFFTVIFIINSVLGFYFAYSISDHTGKGLSTINFARTAVIEIQDQFGSWKNILLTGNRYSDFQKNYYEFSQHSQKVSNLLFNLKLESKGNSKLVEKIDRLRSKHMEISSYFTRQIVELENTNFRKVPEMVKVTHGKDREIVNELNSIVEDMESSVREDTLHTTIIFGLIGLSTFIVFITLIIMYGRELASRLINTHNLLEEKVIERTREIWQMNIELGDEINEHKKTEEKLIAARNEAMEKSTRLSISESRYRSLVEGTGDIIFTLDEDLNFISANNSIKTILKINPEKINSFNLADLIGFYGDDLAVTREILVNRIKKAIKTRKPLSFSAEFKSTNLIEPVSLDVSIEFIEFEDHFEILGKAVKNSEGKQIKAFVSEKTEYAIENRLFDAEEISYKITDNLKRYMPSGEIPPVRIAVREMIINAIEHGNLNITFEEKTASMFENTYFELINKRRKLPEYRNHRVKIEYMVSPKKAVYKITDQGKGFNYKKILSGMNNNEGDVLLEHGRGIMMTRSIFDELSFNKKGNQVLLVKYFNNGKHQEQ